MKVRNKTDKVKIVTMGCSKNTVDSENILTQLQGNEINAFHEDEKPQEENVVIVNTCGFIDLAKQESIDTILMYADKKNHGDIEKLYVTGCLSERYKNDLEKEIPEVDAYFGTFELPGLLAKFNADYKHELIGERRTSTPMHYAYMKISEGCNRTCSFCAIPLMRGGHVSRPIEELVYEAQQLARRGVKELMLIAQELTYYGLDLYKKRALGELLQKLAKVEGIEWIRLHYAYPSKFPREIFDVMADTPEVCNYLDMPLQHASDPVLERMRRQITKAEMEDLIGYARERVPNIAIRTTFLVGYPGETDQEFNDLCDFVQGQRFDRLGVFLYSHEEDTKAHEVEDDILAEIKQERSNRIMEIQSEISFDHNQAKIGKEFKVLIDRKESDHFIGRTEYDS
ncbi:MAG: 30S ribosomal protein S12 methylthiotransferase RimO, partial [Saprospiraceae bacterium]|nr:30S ribosomal protein S12 methylthiotransferase RimO [Saprospiraceae bacterium]